MKKKGFRRKSCPSLKRLRGRLPSSASGGTGIRNELPTWAWGNGTPLTKPSICTCFTAESPDPPLPLPFPAGPVVELEEVAAEPVPSLRDAIFLARQEKRETWETGSGSTDFSWRHAQSEGRRWEDKLERGSASLLFSSLASFAEVILCACAFCLWGFSLTESFKANVDFLKYFPPYV